MIAVQSLTKRTSLKGYGLIAAFNHIRRHTCTGRREDEAVGQKHYLYLRKKAHPGEGELGGLTEKTQKFIQACGRAKAK